MRNLNSGSSVARAIARIALRREDASCGIETTTPIESRSLRPGFATAVVGARRYAAITMVASLLPERDGTPVHLSADPVGLEDEEG
jgi:hypothetical protein